MSDYPVTDDMIAKMKKGKTITVQAINMQGTPISLPLPLTDFAKAYDGPPTDPKVFEEQQKQAAVRVAEEGGRSAQEAGSAAACGSGARREEIDATASAVTKGAGLQAAPFLFAMRRTSN